MKLNSHNIRKGMESIFLYASNVALDMGLLPGHEGFTRFFILSGPRSGSNFLWTALNVHPRMLVFGELFRFPDSIGWDLRAFKHYPYGQSRKMIQLMQSDPVTFLKTRIFKPYPRVIDCVGFKLFYFHARGTSSSKVWNFLRGDTTIKVIHLKRRNLLRTYLSHQRALRSKVWIDQSGKSTAPPPMHLDPVACEHYFRQMTGWQQDSDRLFANHPKIDIFYECLAERFSDEIDKIQDFLQVDKCFLKPSTFKQTKKPPSMDILNYRDLAKHFSGTQWELFFQEE